MGKLFNETVCIVGKQEKWERKNPKRLLYKGVYLRKIPLGKIVGSPWKERIVRIEVDKDYFASIKDWRNIGENANQVFCKKNVCKKEKKNVLHLSKIYEFFITHGFCSILC